MIEPVRIDCPCGGWVEFKDSGLVNESHQIECLDLDDVECECCCDCDIDYEGLTDALIEYVEFLGGSPGEFNDFTSIRRESEYYVENCEGVEH